MAKTRKKKNPILTLCLLALALAALLIGYKVLAGVNDRREAAEAEAAAAGEDTVTVAAFDPADMTALEYRYGSGEVLRFEVVNGAWRYAADPRFPLDAQALASMGTSVSSIAAVRTVDEGEPADYGLDEPVCEVTAEYGGAGRHVYKTGDYNSFAGAYYLMADGDIYLVSSNLTSVFSKSLDDLIVRDTIPASEWTTREYVSSVTVRDGDAERVITDAEEIDGILTELSRVYLRTVADYFTEEEEREAAGLDGSRAVTVAYRKAVSTSDSEGNSTTNYLDTSYTLLFGNEGETGTYASPLTSTILYEVDAETVSGLLAHAAGWDPEP